MKQYRRKKNEDIQLYPLPSTRAVSTFVSPNKFAFLQSLGAIPEGIHKSALMSHKNQHTIQSICISYIESY